MARAALVLPFLLLLSFAGPAVAAVEDLILPAIGRIAGGGASEFHTTVWITNPSTAEPREIEMQFLLTGQANLNPARVAVILQPGETRVWENAAETLFGISGIPGALRLRANGAIVAASRIYEKAPGDNEDASRGSFYAAVPAPFGIAAGERAILQGLRQNTDYRYNLFLVESAGQPVSLDLSIVDVEGVERFRGRAELEPYEQTIVPLASMIAEPVRDATLRALASAGEGRAILTGSLVANASHDGSGFVMATPGRVDAGTITAVLAGEGLEGGGTAGEVTLGLAPGAVVRSVNGLADHVRLEGGANVSISRRGDAIEIDATGVEGPVGPEGPRGPRGERGAEGPAGAPGADGSTGPAGPEGPAGATGAEGPTGPAGATGADGAQGATGPAGPQGATGPMGPAGAMGADGAQGATGPSGPAGPTGPGGPTGATGATGAEGSEGPTGLTGPTGATGAPGLVWRGDWDASIAYSIDDAVASGGSSWVAIAPSTGELPDSSAAWELLAAGGLMTTDADTLDGLDSLDFAAAAHVHAGGDITSGIVGESVIDSAVARDNEIVPTVLASDGAGSGLDADLIDGADSSVLRTTLWSDSATATVDLSDGSCKEIASIAVTAPVDGTLVIRANVIANINHTNLAVDRLKFYVITIPNCVGSEAAVFEVPASAPTAPSIHGTVSPVEIFPMTSGESRTYLLNATSEVGASVGDAVHRALMVATFIPD